MDDAVVFRTSGSTGEPKEIVRSLAQMRADAANIARAFAGTLKRAGAFAASVRAEHFYGALWRDLVPAALGLPAAKGAVLSVENLASRAAGGPVVFVTTPSFLGRAVAHPDFPSLRGRLADVVSSGGPLREDVSKAVMDAAGVSPLEIYGSTEAGTIAWRRRAEGGTFRLMDGVDASADAEGRLVVRSPFAAESPLAVPDVVCFASDRSFELSGRADRLVKILESLVSLTAVEQALEGHPFVSSARAEAYDSDGVARVGAVAVPTPAARDAVMAAGEWNAAVARIRRDLVHVLGAAAFPRRLRFLRELPADARGKTPASAVRAALDANCREPVVASWSATAGRLVAEMAFPKDCECFAGHFPGRPILPGVAQLFFLRKYAHQAFADFPDAGTYVKLKFKRIVLPGETLALDVVRKAPGVFAFTMSVGGETASCGTLEGAAK